MVGAMIEVEEVTRMTKKIVMVLFSFFVLVGCANNAENHVHEDSEKIIIDREKTKINVVKLNDGDLLSTEYRIINQTKESAGPFYVNYIFHGQLLQDALGLDEFSSYKKMGGEGIKLGPNDIYNGGDNLEILEDKRGLINLKNAENNTIEIQIIDINTNKVLASQEIQNISYINES